MRRGKLDEHAYAKGDQDEKQLHLFGQIWQMDQDIDSLICQRA